MKESHFFQRMQDGSHHSIYTWEPNEGHRRIGVVQLIHGSCEHSARYRDFAAYLTNHGYIVVANDLRGHGLTAKNLHDLGYFADEDGWETLVKDLFEVNQYSKSVYSGLPVYMIGHSMGSFLARHYSLIYGDTINGLVAIGTSHQTKMELQLGMLAALLGMKYKGNKKTGYFLNKFTYEVFNKEINLPRTKSDWITRNEQIVDDFIKDERCGFIFSHSAFRDMFTGLLFITNSRHIKNGPTYLPIYLLSGLEDPVGNKGKQVKKALMAYQRAGYDKVSIKLYPDMRHEILNELGNKLVYQDIVNWLQKYTS